MRLSDRFFETRSTGRNDFWEGAVGKRCAVFSYLYLAVAIGALIAYGFCGPEKVEKLVGLQRVMVILIGLFVSAALPFYYWCEALAFDSWISNKFPKNRTAQEPQRERFRLNLENAKAFWAGIVAVYAAVLLSW